jgi:uncharacterized protein
MTPPLTKLKAVQNICKEYADSQVIVAYSGGIDSSLMAKIAHGVLGDQVLAVTAQSPSLPALELELAQQHIQELGIAHRLIRTNELDNPNYFRNLHDRCYFCKSELHQDLHLIASTYPQAVVMDGVNGDDLHDYRPGIKAAREYRVRSPLAEVQMTKLEVRQLAKYLGLSWWDKPAQPCLSSRFPFGEVITPAKLQRVEMAETYLRQSGWEGNLRVRSISDTARIEIDHDRLDQFASAFPMTELEQTFQSFGFRVVLLDHEGFRSGKLNPNPKKEGG